MKTLLVCFISALFVCAGIADTAVAPKAEEAAPLKAGKLLCELNVREKSADWEKFENYGNRLVHGYEVVDNTPVMTLRNAAKQKHDTAWSLLSREIPLDASVKNLIVEIDFRADLSWNVPNMPKTPFRNCVIWYDGSKKKIRQTDIAYAGYPKKFTQSQIQLEVPSGTASFRVQFGADWPDIINQQFIAYRSVRVFAAE